MPVSDENSITMSRGEILLTKLLMFTVWWASNYQYSNSFYRKSDEAQGQQHSILLEKKNQIWEMTQWSYFIALLALDRIMYVTNQEPQKDQGRNISQYLEYSNSIVKSYYNEEIYWLFLFPAVTAVMPNSSTGPTTPEVQRQVFIGNQRKGWINQNFYHLWHSDVLLHHSNFFTSGK